MYIFLTVISAFLLAGYDVFKKIGSKYSENLYEMLFFYTFISFLCSIFFVFDAVTVGLDIIAFVFIKSSVISLSWFFTMKAISRLDVSFVTPFSMLGVVSTTLLASIIFKEKIGVIQIGGILLILLGLVLLVRIDEKKGNKKNDYKYAIYLAIAAFLSSVSAVIDRRLLFNVGKETVIFWFFFFLALIYFVVCLIRNRKIEFINLKNNLWLVLVGVSIFLSDLFYCWALSYSDGLLSIVSIVRKLSVFISVVLACLFLKERDFTKKILLLVLMFVGLGGILFI